VSPRLAQRVLALAAAALLAGVGGVAAAAKHGERSRPTRALPPPATASVRTWAAALAGVRAPQTMDGRRSACGQILRSTSLGVTHPVIPCGAKVYVAYGGRVVLTQVIDRGPFGEAREFDLTPALAELLHLDGVQSIRWTFARRA
jgi:hypothetical protein